VLSRPITLQVPDLLQLIHILERYLWTSLSMQIAVDWEGIVALIQCAKAMGIQKYAYSDLITFTTLVFPSLASCIYQCAS
nr:hypothetical protein [Tanacetum cinerariifolium]